MNIGWTEILVILLFILLLFGAKRLPDLARSLGKSLREFKKGRDESGRDEGANGAKKDNDQNGGG